MSYIFSLISLFNIWFILKQTSIFRWNKNSKKILLQAVQEKNNSKVNNILNKNFIKKLSEDKKMTFNLLSSLVSLDNDVIMLDFKKIKKLNKDNVQKILWYFKKKKQIEKFLKYNISNTKFFNSMNESILISITNRRRYGEGDFSGMIYINLRGEEEFYFGSSKNNLDKISYEYLKDLVILERWKKMFFK